MHGLGVGLHGTLLAGASVVLLPRFDPDAVLDAARDTAPRCSSACRRCTTGSPRRRGPTELASLRLCVSGSAPLPPTLSRQLRDDGGHDVLERYGMTETLMNVSNPYDGERRAGTVGFPLPGSTSGWRDDGEILVRGPNVFPGYWERPDANAEAFSTEATGRLVPHRRHRRRSTPTATWPSSADPRS